MTAPKIALNGHHTLVQRYSEFLALSVGELPPGFEARHNRLFFHQIDLAELINTHGTPLRFTYLPIIRQRVRDADALFRRLMAGQGYPADYTYCYCTKSSHHRFVLETVLAEGAGLETSSAADMALAARAHQEGLLPSDRLIVCNGFKPASYLEGIRAHLRQGFRNLVPVLDHAGELEVYEALAEELGERLPIGLRMAVEEAPEHDVYTSRFGIARPAIEELAGNRLAGHPGLELRMLHFYLQTGIKDSSYYWIELEKAAELYAKLRLQHPTLTALNIGGGLPYRDSLVFDFDYEAITAKILTVIRGVCEAMGVPLPAIVTEFGAYTVAEASGMIFRVLHRKVQNDRETWLMLDGSLITALPDTWALGRRFLLLPVNHWDRSPERVVLGGLTCDSQDYYARDAHHDNLYLPHAGGTEPLYLGFFHTGAYQQALAGEGGAHHCLVPDPPQLVLDADETGACFERAYRPAQRAEDILPLLGFGQGRGSNCQDYHPDRP